MFIPAEALKYKEPHNETSELLYFSSSQTRFTVARQAIRIESKISLR